MAKARNRAFLFDLMRHFKNLETLGVVSFKPTKTLDLIEDAALHANKETVEKELPGNEGRLELSLQQLAKALQTYEDMNVISIDMTRVNALIDGRETPKDHPHLLDEEMPLLLTLSLQQLIKALRVYNDLGVIFIDMTRVNAMIDDPDIPTDHRHLLQEYMPVLESLFNNQKSMVSLARALLPCF